MTLSVKAKTAEELAAEQAAAAANTSTTATTEAPAAGTDTPCETCEQNAQYAQAGEPVADVLAGKEDIIKDLEKQRDEGVISQETFNEQIALVSREALNEAGYENGDGMLEYQELANAAEASEAIAYDDVNGNGIRDAGDAVYIKFGNTVVKVITGGDATLNGGDDQATVTAMKTLANITEDAFNLHTFYGYADGSRSRDQIGAIGHYNANAGGVTHIESNPFALLGSIANTTADNMQNKLFDLATDSGLSKETIKYLASLSPTELEKELESFEYSLYSKADIKADIEDYNSGFMKNLLAALMQSL